LITRHCYQDSVFLQRLNPECLVSEQHNAEGRLKTAILCGHPNVVYSKLPSEMLPVRL